MEKNVVRVLALHGYSQNGMTMARSIRPFFTGVRGESNVISPDGPYVVDSIPDKPDPKGWWPMNNHGCAVPGIVRSPHEMMRLIPAGHYDIVMGFSQGAVAAVIAPTLRGPCFMQ